MNDLDFHHLPEANITRPYTQLGTRSAVTTQKSRGCERGMNMRERYRFLLLNSHGQYSPRLRCIFCHKQINLEDPQTKRLLVIMKTDDVDKHSCH